MIGWIRLRPDCPWKPRRYTMCSWRISTILKSFLVVLLPCSWCFPLVVRPMRTILEMFLKIFFNSPEFNCSIIFSMYIGLHEEEDESISSILALSESEVFPWFNISPNSCPNRNCSCGRARRFSSLWFCFGLWSACKILRIQFERIFFDLNLWNLLLIVVQIHHKVVWSTRKSDPAVSIVSVHKTKFWSQLRTCHASNSLQLPIRVQFWCSLWIHPFGCDASSSLGRVYSRQATVLNCVRFSGVFRHEVLSNFNNIQKSCLHTKFAQFVLLW